MGTTDLSSFLTCASVSSNMLISSLAASSTSELFKCKVREPFIQSSCYQIETNIHAHLPDSHLYLTVIAAFINTNVRFVKNKINTQHDF